MTQSNAKSKHHHGNLKQALIAAGIGLLEEGGLDALSLRKCAARAGVSHAAPAHHFDGLPGLKIAIADEGFRIFSGYLQDAVDAGEQTDRGRLKSICRGYFQFGLTHSGILNVIFGAQGLAGLRAGQDPDREKADAYLILQNVCAPFVPAGQNSLVVELQVWSLIHGFTLLSLAQEFGRPDQPIEDGLFDAVMGLLDQLGNCATP